MGNIMDSQKSGSHPGAMTVLLVSQRIATVMKADHILCMEDGRVCGFGTHEELLENCEPYRAIYRSQIGAGVEAQEAGEKGGMLHG